MNGKATPKPPQGQERRMLKILEAARILNSSERYVREKIKAGQLVAFRSGRFIRIPAEALAEFLERGKRA